MRLPQLVNLIMTTMAARDKRAWKLEFYESGHINKATNLIAYFRLIRKQLRWIKFYSK